MRDARVKEAMSYLMRPWIGSCATTEARMSDHLDGDISRHHERRFLRHLARCRRCAEVFDSLVRTVERVRSLGREDAGKQMATVVEAVTLRIRHEPR